MKNFTLPVEPQPTCKRPFTNSTYNRCDWKPNITIKIPEEWSSGLYLIKATHAESGYQSNQVFLIQGVSEHVPMEKWEEADVLLIHASTTEMGAYNTSTKDPSIGSSFYRSINSKGFLSQISFDKKIITFSAFRDLKI